MNNITKNPMTKEEADTELKIACAKLQLLIMLNKAHPSQEDIDMQWKIMGSMSTQKRRLSMK